MASLRQLKVVGDGCRKDKEEIVKRYFAYGSNLWRKQMEDRCPDHRVIGKGVLRGYRWMISSRGYATIVKSTSDEVYGVVYEIPESDEKSLDHYEGVQSGSYRKEMFMVEVEREKGRGDH
jgi:gamma-glutamylcyclotransferase (GGCT)/AIG2-like uncharacterized protein YtfP